MRRRMGRDQFMGQSVMTRTGGWRVWALWLAGTVAAAGLAVAGGGCKTTYYRTMEAFGKHKREILVSRVQAAQKDQEEAKQTFTSALDRFSALVNDSGGDLRKAYDKATSELERSESKAKDVHSRVDAVATVGTDLFKEWEQELAQYSSAELRRTSERQLRDTRAKYDAMLGAMRRAEGTMEPVLSAFRDQVLFLKHNLNAQAVASLKGNVADLERDIGALIREMEASIAEAERFTKEMRAG
jgi:hypothetical protein